MRGSPHCGADRGAAWRCVERRLCTQEIEGLVEPLAGFRLCEVRVKGHGTSADSVLGRLVISGFLQFQRRIRSGLAIRSFIDYSLEATGKLDASREHVLATLASDSKETRRSPLRSGPLMSSP